MPNPNANSVKEKYVKNENIKATFKFLLTAFIPYPKEMKTFSL